MENELQIYNDQELDDILGTKVAFAESYKVVHIDNGTDIMGTGATGDFITKEFNQEAKSVNRIPFAKTFNGVILAAKAQLIDKGKFPTWRTNEFDSTNKAEKIKVFPLKDGKMIKNAVTNKIVADELTYEEIKQTRKVPLPDGTSQSTYNYFVILYVGLDNGEIIKLKFKGTSRGNFFDYSKAISYTGAAIYNVMTLFSTYKDQTTGKFAIKFDYEKNDKGFPKSVDAEEVRKMRVVVAERMKSSNLLSIESNKTPLIDVPQPPVDYSDNEEIDINDIPIFD